ncbi:MAG: FAD-dependent oxidoreductase [Chloroflexi bacterium RBG_16_47_49]|nr:MAG: FAD-dependent oxidoreductase [Chloroflexi bacterium RBG_16_47_49]
MPFPRHPRAETLKSLADAAPVPFWLDDPGRPEAVSALTSTITTDLVVIGAGFTGLWTAFLAKEADPSREVVLLEAEETASGASGRNGGFVAASLTHGFENGRRHWPNELETLITMGQANLEAIDATVKRLGIECDFLRSGEIMVATEPYQVEELCHLPARAASFGENLVWLDRDQTRALVDSPLYLGGLYNPIGVAMVNPAQLAWGLRRACLSLGVRLFERTPVLLLEEDNKEIHVRTSYGSVQAKRVAIATNAFPPLIKQLSHYIVPVYDYALVTEPLSVEQRNSIGWQDREGVSDSNQQFHYYRITADRRILWGGYDAVYHRNNGVGKHFETDPVVFGRLAEHFFMNFPQLEGVRFTHAFGGAIDTCTRFSPFWGTTHAGRTAYVLGFTGLGVGSSRFGAQVMLDILDGKVNARTKLEMVRKKPAPFPPEPFRSMVINLTRKALDQADRNQGRRNLWLQILDGLGVGFDS